MSLNGRVYQTDLQNLTAGIAFKYKGKDFFVLNQEHDAGCEGCCFQHVCVPCTGPKCWNNEKDFIFKELP